MKIKPEHYAHMRDAIKRAAPTINTRAHYVENRVGNDPEKRYRWDLAYAAELSAWIGDNVYPYADDTHVDTALRSIVTDLNL